MDWVSIAQTLGVSVACLAGLGWAVWAAVKWSASQIFRPLVQGHLAFLDSLKGEQKAQTESMVQQTKVLGEMQGQLRALTAWVERQAKQ
jgi:hypothetical protein